MKYIVPEYYKNFKCKCGTCRNSCCEGWPVRISRKEYYRLLSLPCSNELRIKLDCALKICPEPSNECYAQVSADWQGLCMLHREDGFCALQTELGEDSLPEVCRLYPRKTIAIIQDCEGSCSSSCEAVVEALMNIKSVLHFEEIALSITPEFKVNLSSKKYACCKNSISILQNRSLSLVERFFMLGNSLTGVEFITGEPDNLSFAYRLLHELGQYYVNNLNIGDYCKVSHNYYGIVGKELLSEEDTRFIAKKHKAAAEQLELILPDWQILFEQLFVNHMFYNNFPYTDTLDDVNDSFLSLVILYAFLRFHILGYMSDKTDQVRLVDFLAAMFRVIEHSNFQSITVKLLKNKKCSAQEYVPELLSV